MCRRSAETQECGNDALDPLLPEPGMTALAIGAISAGAYARLRLKRATVEAVDAA